MMRRTDKLLSLPFTLPLTLAILLGLLLLIVTSQPASAQELSLDVRGAFGVVEDDAYFGFADEDANAFVDIGVAGEVWNHLAVFAEYRTGVEQTVLFETIDSDLATHAARLGVVYRYPLLTWLHPYVLAGVGFNWVDLDLDTPTATYDDTTFGVSGFAAGGLELVWYFGDPDGGGKVTFWDRLGLGVSNDYGYAFGPSLAFDEVVAEDGAGANRVDLGEVDLSGFTWRVGLTIRYRL